MSPLNAPQDRPVEPAPYHPLIVNVADVVACFARWRKEPHNAERKSHLESALIDLDITWRGIQLMDLNHRLALELRALPGESAKALQDDPVER